MPKFNVTVLETTTLNFEIEAVNADEAEKLSYDMDRKLAKASEPTREVSASSRKLEPQELVYKMQIDNIRADYERLHTKQTLADGTMVDDGTAETMKVHLAKLHDALVDQSGLDIPHLAQVGSVVAEHLGEDVTRKSREPIVIDNPEEIWKRCATAFGWEFDEDYKGWIKPANIKDGARRGEWDAFVRDMTAEDACNEEGIDTVEEAAEALA